MAPFAVPCPSWRPWPSFLSSARSERATPRPEEGEDDVDSSGANGRQQLSGLKDCAAGTPVGRVLCDAMLPEDEERYGLCEVCSLTKTTIDQHRIVFCTVVVVWPVQTGTWGKLTAYVNGDQPWSAGQACPFHAATGDVMLQAFSFSPLGGSRKEEQS